MKNLVGNEFRLIYEVKKNTTLLSEQSNEPVQTLLRCFIDIVTQSLWRFVTNKYWFLSFMVVIILLLLLCKLDALLNYINGGFAVRVFQREFYGLGEKASSVHITR